jgi:isopenicillin N synthase-like dioxygenase
LINVGFLYLSTTPVQPAAIDSLISYVPEFFALSAEEKERVKLANSPHFLIYSKS